MAGTKRTAPSESTGATTRSAKAAKTDAGTSAATTKAVTAKKGGKRGAAKANLPASTFKSRATPLHVTISHAAHPSSEGDNSSEGVVGTLTLAASSFATGSYGWKGSRRITVEIPGAEGSGGEKEKVQVMLTINATVLGSKGAKGDTEGGDEEEEGEAAAAAAVAGAGADAAPNGNAKEEEEEEGPKEAQKAEGVVVEAAVAPSAVSDNDAIMDSLEEEK